jgi:surfactin synthase thioesterase subunit
VHPGVFDACAQLAHAALPAEVDDDIRFIVTQWNEVTWSATTPRGELWCHVSGVGYDRATAELRGAFTLLDSEGTVLARMRAGVMKGIGAVHEEAFARLAGADSARFGDRDGASESVGTRPVTEVIARLYEVDGLRRENRLREYLRRCFADLLKMPVDELDVREPLSELGLDSLVGVTAGRQIESDLGVSLAIETLIEGPSVAELTEVVLPELRIVEPEPEAKRPADAPDQRSRWIQHRRRNPAARLKLFCIPYGRGKGASVYRDWQRHVPEDIEVCPVQLPGKESRVRETAFQDVTQATDALAEALAPELDRPYAFYGHSVGGLLAYRLAFRLWETHHRRPEHLFVGAYSAPPVYPNPMVALTVGMFKDAGFDDIPMPDSLSNLSPQERDAVLRVLTAESDLSSELAKVLLPSRLAELKLVQGYRFDGRRFDVPVTAFHGLRDDRVDESHMRTWAEVTDGAFVLHLLSGDHLFLDAEQDRDLLLRHIVRGLSD